MGAHAHTHRRLERKRKSETGGGEGGEEERKRGKEKRRLKQMKLKEMKAEELGVVEATRSRWGWMALASLHALRLSSTDDYPTERGRRAEDTITITTLTTLTIEAR